MTNERKVTVLENLLFEREKLIEQLQMENEKKELELYNKKIEIQEMMNDHIKIANSLEELRGIIATTKEQSAEYDRLIKDMKTMKSQYEKDMKRFMSKLK